jgi:hypothetical protein
MQDVSAGLWGERTLELCLRSVLWRGLVVHVICLSASAWVKRLTLIWFDNSGMEESDQSWVQWPCVTCIIGLEVPFPITGIHRVITLDHHSGSCGCYQECHWQKGSVLVTQGMKLGQKSEVWFNLLWSWEREVFNSEDPKGSLLAPRTSKSPEQLKYQLGQTQDCSISQFLSHELLESVTLMHSPLQSLEMRVRCRPSPVIGQRTGSCFGWNRTCLYLLRILQSHCLRYAKE